MYRTFPLFQHAVQEHFCKHFSPTRCRSAVFFIVVACFNLQRHYPELTCELPAVRQQFISSDAAYMSSQDGQEPTLLDQDMC